MIQVFRYEVPVDEAWHAYDLNGPVLHVGCRKVDVVEFWAEVHGGVLPVVRRLRVYGTGQPVPSGAAYRGTALTPPFLSGSAAHGIQVAYGTLVWHLYEHPLDTVSES